MATVTIRPNSDIAQSSATKSAGSTFYGCVDEATLDTGDYISLSSFGGYATFNFASTGLTTETINSVTAYVYSDDDFGVPSIVGDGHLSETYTTSQVSGKLYSKAFTTNPETSSAWAAADIPGVELGAAPYSDPDFKNGQKFYQFYLVVDYEESAGGDDYTLTCAAGSYSLTGTNVTLTATVKQNLTLACNAGSYSLTGTNADLTVKRNYVLTCGAGSYALTGTNATFFAAIKPATDAMLTNQAFGWYGFPVGGFPLVADPVNQDYTLTCAAGTYSLTGTNATLDPTFHYSLICEAGSYTLTGTDVDFVLQRNYTLVCGVGSYSLTGTDTTLEVKRNYVLECGVGSYSLTGTDVTLTVQRNYTLVCEAGSYTLTGTDITFGNTTAYTLVCEAGSYDLTGSNVSFVIQHNYTFVCEAGSYSLTGSDATFNANYVFALGMGSYVLVGTSVGLFILSSTPACRTYTIDAEGRLYAILAESREFDILAENRTYAVLQCTDDD